MSSTPKPFDCQYTPQLAELLHNLNISLVISTYQAGKVILLSAREEDKIIQLPRTFSNAMGLAFKDEKLAVAAKEEVVVLQNSRGLAPQYPKKPGVYDAIFVPRASYHSGYLALHDMEYLQNGKLAAVNTVFSCLAYIDDNYSFIPFWKPPFISDLASEDRCHLNGMAVEKDEIKYVTALGKSNKPQGWRDNKMDGGVLMEVPSGKILQDKLAMPHSPRVYDGKLYFLNSAAGELVELDPKTGKSEIIVNLGGFARGMDRIGDYLFIGVSKLRHNNKVFNDLPIAKTSFAGVIAVHLPYKTIVGKLEYKMSVDEIYDVKILPQMKRPSILSPSMEVSKLAMTIPNGNLWLKKQEEK